jgi:hypothetical protein
LKAIYFLYQFEHGRFLQLVSMLMERSLQILKDGVQLVLGCGRAPPHRLRTELASCHF